MTVKVKPLEWVEINDDLPDARLPLKLFGWEADTPFDRHCYVIRLSDGGGAALYDGWGGWVQFLGADEAKAAAQEDFENRVLDCLNLEEAAA